MGHAKLRELKKPSPITYMTEEALPLCTQRQFSREKNGRGNDRPRLESKQRGLAATQAAAALSSVSAGADGEAGATDVAGRRAVRAGSWMSMGGYGCVAGSSDVATATRPAKPVLVAVEDTLVTCLSPCAPRFMT